MGKIFSENVICYGIDSDSLVPVEVKAKDGATASLNHLIDWPSYPDVSYGIKFGYKNIGWGGKFYTFPYFLAFLLKRFLKEAGRTGREL